MQLELENAEGIDASNLATKSYFIALKAEVGKLDIKELVKGPTGLKNLKTEVDKQDVGKPIMADRRLLLKIWKN